MIPRDNPQEMSISAGRPIWEEHPLWLDRERLEAITQRMWLEIQKVMFPSRPRRPMGSPGKTELTVVGGSSVEDAFGEALRDLLTYQPKRDVTWEAVGITIARRRAVDAIRTAKKHRELPDGSEIDIVSLYAENEKGERLSEKLVDLGDAPDDEVIDRILRTDRLLAFRKVAEEVLPQRDRNIVFRYGRGETNAAIAQDVGLTEQRIGQIYRESLRKINAKLRNDPQYRRLYEFEGGTPND